MDNTIGQVGPITFATQVTQIQMAQVGGHNLLGGLSGGVIGKMPVAAQDALLEAPGPPRAILQHFDIVIGLQHQNVRGAHPLKNEFGGVAKIGQKTDVPARRSQQKTDRVLRIVRNGERFHQDVPHLKRRAGAEQPARKPCVELVFDRFLGWPVAIHRDPQLFAQGHQGLHVIGMFVRDQNPGQILRGSTDAGQTLPNLAKAEPCINQHARLFGLDVGAITGRTAAQYS